MPNTNPNQQSPDNQQGTGFTNLQDIYAANTGNQLGNTISQGIGNVANQAESNLNQQSQNFYNQANANNYNNAQNQQEVSGVMSNLQNNPTGIGQNDVNQFKTWEQGQYGGPSGLQNYAQAVAQGQEAQGLGQQTQSEGGRLGLLQRFVGGPQYTQGQQGLDAVLLNQQNNLGQVQQQTANLPTQVQQAQNQAQSYAQNVANQNQQFAQGINQGLSQFGTGLQGSLQNQFQSAVSNANNQYAQTQAALAANQGVNSNIYQNLGVNPGQILYGTNLAQYVGQGALPGDVSQTATSNQAAQAAALAQLSGQNSLVNASEAGSYNPANALTYNQAGAQAAITGNQNNYNNALNSIYLNQGTGAYNDLIKGGQQGSPQAALQALQQQGIIGYGTPQFGGSVGLQAGLNSPALQSPVNQQQRDESAELNALKNILNQQYGAGEVANAGLPTGNVNY